MVNKVGVSLMCLEGKTSYGQGDTRFDWYRFKQDKDVVIPYGLGKINK